MFVAFYPPLQTLNIMRLATPQSAILSAIIFNAVISSAHTAVAQGRALSPDRRRCLWRADLRVGGVIIPFFGIKAIDLVVTALHLA